MIYRLLGGLLLAVLLAVGGYIRGCTVGKRDAVSAHEADRATWQAKFDQQEADAIRREGQLAKDHQEAERATEADLAATRAAMADFPRRLRLAVEAASAGRGKVCPGPAADGEGSAAPEGPGDLAELVGRLDAAREASLDDAAALTDCQIKYDAAVRATASNIPSPP